jgi:CTP:molybdopterin cytidylyltransferase MocA
MQDPKIIAIILAAGKGSRFGMPKVDAVFGGITFLERIRNTLTTAGISEIFVARDLPTSDMLESLQYAAQHTSAAAGYLIFPVDHPFVNAATIVEMVSTFNLHPNAVIRPLYEARTGHPIIIPACLDLWMPNVTGGLAQIIRQSGVEVLNMPTPDQGVLRNINTAADIGL